MQCSKCVVAMKVTLLRQMGVEFLTLYLALIATRCPWWCAALFLKNKPARGRSWALLFIWFKYYSLQRKSWFIPLWFYTSHSVSLSFGSASSMCVFEFKHLFNLAMYFSCLISTFCRSLSRARAHALALSLLLLLLFENRCWACAVFPLFRHLNNNSHNILYTCVCNAYVRIWNWET